MQSSATPAQESLWQFALACTNDSSGAARVVASIVRDYGRLDKVSEARLRRSVLERAKLWAARSASESTGSVQPISPLLQRLDINRRGLLWLDAGEGLTVIELSWIFDTQPGEIRAMLDDLRAQVLGEKPDIASDLARAFEALPRDELEERLTEACQRAARRDRRRSALFFIGLAIFAAVMVFVLFDLLSWQDASSTLPDRPDPPTAAPDPAMRGAGP